MNANTGSNDSEQPGHGAERIDIRRLSPEQLVRLGMSQIAYVKPVIFNGEPAFAIHAADGTPMAVAADRELAIAAVVQHEMMPTLVH